MGRGLDGFFHTLGCVVVPSGCCAVLKDRGGSVPHHFPVALARGKHLFPFRTEQLSPSAPMVLGLKGPGRVGRRRFIVRRTGPPREVARSASGHEREHRAQRSDYAEGAHGNERSGREEADRRAD